jgi:hypothetical protein
VLVATFGTDTAWAGRKVTHEDGRFVLEGFGVIAAAQVLEYDRATPLVWTTEGTRAWVRSVAHREDAAGQTVAPPAASGTDAAVCAVPDEASPALVPPGEAVTPHEADRPAIPVPSSLDEVERVAAQHAAGELGDADSRAALAQGRAPAGPEQSGPTSGAAQTPAACVGPVSPAVMSPEAKAAALARLDQLRISGLISEQELAAMRAKLLE